MGAVYELLPLWELFMNYWHYEAVYELLALRELLINCCRSVIAQVLATGES